MNNVSIKYNSIIVEKLYSSFFDFQLGHVIDAFYIGLLVDMACAEAFTWFLALLMF